MPDEPAPVDVPQPAQPIPEEVPEVPAQPPAAPDLPAEPEEELAAEWGNWRFTGDGPLTYAAVPVTVAAGDVITHPGPPADDGRWEPTDEPVTRLRDNHRPEPEPEAEAEAVEASEES